MPGLIWIRLFRVMALVATAAASGCGAGSIDSGVDGGDGPDGGIGPDGGEPVAGLVIQFRASPGLSLDLGGPFDLDIDREVSYELRDVTAIGDAAPGDDRTTLSQVSIVWKEPEEDDDPWDTTTQIVYPDAPAGIYSSLVFRLEHYRFRGELTTDQPREFDIQDDPDSTNVVVNLQNGRLEVGGMTEVAIDVDVATPVQAVDWSLLPSQDTLELRESDTQMADVRAAVRSSFSVP